MINGDELKWGQDILWRGRIVQCGNTGHNLIEIYENGKFKRCTKDIYVKNARP
jgi:hypothetical protein